MADLRLVELSAAPNVAVGYVRGGDVLEFISQDPKIGSVFYTLKQTDDGGPQFERNDASCVFCHVSDVTYNVPGPFIGSVFPTADGTANYGPVYMTDAAISETRRPKFRFDTE